MASDRLWALPRLTSPTVALAEGLWNPLRVGCQAPSGLHRVKAQH